MRARVGWVVGVLIALTACAHGPPTYHVEVPVSPTRVPLLTIVEVQLEELGYEILERSERSISITVTGLKIRPGRNAGTLLYDWLHVTITAPTTPSAALPIGGPRLVVSVHGESAEEDRERVGVDPSPTVIADANRLVEVLRAAR